MLKKDMDEEIFELMLVDDEDGVFANSFVHSGAIERDFVFFGKEEMFFKSVNDEKRLVAGPLLVPNKKILRVDGEGKRYFVYFTPETIEKIARKFMKDGNGHEVTLEHGNKKVNDIYLTESWIVAQSAKDKSNLYNFTLPIGTWFGVYKVENDEVWDKVKDGTFRGYSIEGLFEHRKSDIKLSLEKSIDELSDDEATEILSKIKTMFQSYSDYGSGVKGNAKRGRELNEKNGNKCATQVGKVRSAQLEAGEAISLETLKRMYSYLSRAEVYYDETEMNSCGTISFLLWGGKAGLSYSRNKLRELGEIELKEGVPHYTKDGELWEGPYHKNEEGRLMTGEVHSEVSRYLYHKEELEAIPSITSSYPGQAASGSISPAKI